MLAFSGCYYGGGEKERYELGEIRKRWETLPVRFQSFISSHLTCSLSLQILWELFFSVLYNLKLKRFPMEIYCVTATGVEPG